jgi:hypothetical protein
MCLPDAFSVSAVTTQLSCIQQANVMPNIQWIAEMTHQMTWHFVLSMQMQKESQDLKAHLAARVSAPCRSAVQSA